MICPYCGKENLEKSSLCNYCGGFLVATDVHSTSEVLPHEPAAHPETSPVEPAIEVDQPATQPEIKPAQPTVIVDQPAAQPEIHPAEQLQPPLQRSRGGRGKWIWWFVGCFVVLCLTLSCVGVLWGVFSFSDALDFLKPATSTPTLVPTSTTTHTPTVTFTPMATDTPTITSTPLPSSTPLPTLTFTLNPILANPGVLFYDDFSDPNSGWDRVDESDYMTDYYENAYRMIENNDMKDIWANPDNLSFGDVTVEVDATKNGGPDDNDFGVICRYQDTDHFYYGIISSDGYFGIIKVTLDGSESVGRDYLEYSDLIIQGYATNHIRFDCIGDVLTLYVNGDKLDQQTDSEYASGNVGLIVGTYNTPGTDILFDNFIVLQP
jgi:hypothetical protein